MSASLTNTNNLPIGIFYEDASGKLISCNKKYLETLGLDAFVDQRANWREFLAEEDKTLTLAACQQSIKTRKPVHLTCRLTKNNGNTIWAEIKANPYLEYTGDIQLAGTLTDVTNQAMFNQVLERFKKAVEKTESQIIFTDPTGVVSYVNDGVEKTTGFTPAEVIGTKAGKLWGGLMDKDYYQKMWHQLTVEKTAFSGEVINKKKTGESYYAEINVTPVLDAKGNVEFFVGIERDITYLKEIDKVKNDFISLASHQLRTPLSSIKWLCELFWQEDVSGLSVDQKEIVTKVQTENERLIQLVNSLLNISRIEAKKLTINKVSTDIVNLTKEIVGNFKKQLDDRSQTLELDFPPTDIQVLVDQKLYGEALTNVLSNSSKYTASSGRLWLKGKKTEKEFVVSVTDNGIGIPLNDQRRIFEKFYRASNANHTLTYGNGLGLYFVKWVVEEHGGRIWFESTENIGTTFYLAFPLTPKN